MSRGRTARVFTLRIAGAESVRVPDELIVEEPMSIRVDGELVATTMRTPGNDFELAAGFCVTEGLLGDAAVRTIRYCGQGPASEAEFNDVTVDTAGIAPVPIPRLGPASSSCGICGTVAIDDLRERLRPLEVEPFEIRVLTGLADRIDGQALFSTTGAVHAAVAFDRSGKPQVLREDIGRHNAVDKVTGARVLAGLSPAEACLVVSGRAGFELVQKAVAAGIGSLVAVGAPTSLSVRLATEHGLALYTFTRPGRVVAYSR